MRGQEKEGEIKMSKSIGKRGAEEFRNTLLCLLKPNERVMLAERESSFEALLLENVSSPISVRKAGALFTVSKRTDSSHSASIDFAFRFRITPAVPNDEWWPVHFSDEAGRTIQAEVELAGRTMTNVHLQNELIELANAWAKSIGSQALTCSIAGLI